jgi:uncharacterized membrane protein
MNNINRYTSSLPVQTSFLTNADGTGDQVFTQIKREGNVAIYRRDRVSTGHTYGFEVVVLKQVKAGQPLPGGNVVEKDYESYPGSSSFGKSAWFFMSEADAELKFDKVVKTLSTTPTVEVEATEVVGDVVVPVVEVKKKNDTTWVIPQGEFTQADFAKANGLPERGTVYNILQSVINKGIVKLADRRKIGGGRPTSFYTATA